MKGFSLVELMVVSLVLVLLLAIAIPAYTEFVEQSRRVETIAQIGEMSMIIDRHFSQNWEYPASLADVDLDTRTDSWGRPYAYLRIVGLSGKGDVRKDKSLNPINSDYDLYSLGPDGESKLPLTAPQSHDDIVRASNGGYIGVASDY